MIKYAVMVKAIYENPWTETVEDTPEDAEERKHFLEAHMRGIKVDIVPFEQEPK